MKLAFLITSFLAVTQTLFGYVYGPGNDGQPVEKRSRRNGVAGGSSPSLIGTSSINAYQANVHREISDLQTFGEAPIRFTRLYNSRASTFSDGEWKFGAKNTWQHNWNFEIYNKTTQTYGIDDLKVRYPDGRDYNFTATDGTGAIRVPAADNGDRWFKWQVGTGGTLVTPDGTEYYFEKHNPPNHRLIEVRNGQGLMWTVSYNTAGQMTRISNQFGRWIDINRGTYNGDTVITSVVANDGRAAYYYYTIFNAKTVLYYVYHPVGSAQYSYTYGETPTTGRPVLATANDGMHGGPGARVKYVYNYGTNPSGTVKEERNLVTDQLIVSLPGGAGSYPQILEGNGVEITRKFTAALLSEEWDGLNRATVYTRELGGYGFVTNALVPGVAVAHAYNPDACGRLESHTDPLGKIASTAYNSAGFPTSATNRRTHATTFTRNPNNLVTQANYPDGTYETWSGHNAHGQPQFHRFRSGGTEELIYYNGVEAGGLLGDLKTRKDALNNVTTYTWYTSGLLASVKDARNNTTSYTYNGRGQVLTVTHPDSLQVRFEYDVYGNKTKEVNELLQETIYTYDEYNRVKTVKDPLLRITTYEYGREPGCGTCGYYDTISRIILPSGKLIENTYDNARRKVAQTIAPGTAEAATTSYSYDARGNVVPVTDPRGKVTTYTYDDLGQMLSATDPNGNRTESTYDEEGNRLTDKRADNGVTSMVYDTMGRLTQSTDPLSQVTAYTYNGSDQVLTVRDAKNNNYPYTYDQLGRKLSMGYPDASQEWFSYDAVGNMATYTTRAGQVMTCTYDTRNRDTLCNWSDTTPDIAKTYDSAGRVLTINNSVSLVTYVYDAAGQLTSETQDIALIYGINPPAKTIGYAYTTDGNRSSVTYPGANVISYAYTNRNQIASISEDGPPPMVNYTYDAAGNRLTSSVENGTSTTYGYDNGGRVLSIDHQKTGVSFARLDYGYNSVNAAKYVKRDNLKGDVYGYDATDQVTGVQYEATNPDTVPVNPNRVVGYVYDPAGNRSSITDGYTQSYTVNGSNQYTLAPPGYSMSYDGNGNAISHYPRTYGYDAQSRLVSANSSGGSPNTFYYDGRNRCIAHLIHAGGGYPSARFHYLR